MFMKEEIQAKNVKKEEGEKGDEKKKKGKRK